MQLEDIAQHYMSCVADWITSVLELAAELSCVCMYPSATLQPFARAVDIAHRILVLMASELPALTCRCCREGRM